MKKSGKICIAVAALCSLFLGANQFIKLSKLIQETKESDSVTMTEPEKNHSIPKRIVSLGPAATEILFAVGAASQIAARTDLCDYPPEAKNIPSAGGFDGKKISLEKILEFEPDFVYLYSGMHDYLIPSLKENKIDFYVSDVKTLSDLYKEIETIGKITGHEKKAIDLTENLKENFTKLKMSSENLNAKVYWEVWSNPYITAGGKSFISDVICYAGGKNIFSGLTEPYPVVSEEAIITLNPDVILIPDDSGIKISDVENRKSFSDVSAVKNKNVFLIDAALFTRPGPRIILAAKDLNSKLKNLN